MFDGQARPVTASAIIVEGEETPLMTIDERLETLTHSVELLASMHSDNEKKVTEAIIDIRDAVIRLSMARLRAYK